MPTSKASATWEGGLREGKGRFKGQTETVSGSYNFGTRFVGEPGSTPEELLAAAHAACYSMALSAQLEGAGNTPQSVATDAACTVEKVGEGFKITTMKLTTRANVPGIDNAKFQEIANKAKEGCPVSQALAGVNIQLEATLE